MYIVINLKRYLLCFANFTHAFISTQIQIQTQEYTNYQSINGRVYMLQLYPNYSSPYMQNEHDTFYLRSLVIYACPKGTKLRTCTYHFHYANIIFICPNISFNPNSSKLRKNRQSRVQIRRSRVEIRRSRV